MTRLTRLGLLPLLLAGCATAQSEDRSVSSIRIDHVILGVADLDRGIADLQRVTGVRGVIGGSHPGRGTRNALMSLGDGTYLEIVAPDPAQAIDNDEIRELRALTRPTPIGWAVSAEDAVALRSILDRAAIGTSSAEPGSRAKPDGSILRWITFGYEKLDSLMAPFFIVWADPTLHPSRTSPTGCRLTSLHIASPDADAVSRAVAPLRLNVSVSNGTNDRMRLSLSCPKGNVSLF